MTTARVLPLLCALLACNADPLVTREPPPEDASPDAPLDAPIVHLSGGGTITISLTTASAKGAEQTNVGHTGTVTIQGDPLLPIWIYNRAVGEAACSVAAVTANHLILAPSQILPITPGKDGFDGTRLCALGTGASSLTVIFWD